MLSVIITMIIMLKLILLNYISQSAVIPSVAMACHFADCYNTVCS